MSKNGELEFTVTSVWIYADPAKQCAAVTTQRGDTNEPPHTCCPPCCRLTCQGQSSMKASVPPTMRS